MLRWCRAAADVANLQAGIGRGGFSQGRWPHSRDAVAGGSIMNETSDAVRKREERKAAMATLKKLLEFIAPEARNFELPISCR